MTKISVGQDAPDFTLESTDGPLTLSELAASAECGVILYFYPKADTPGCTTEACDFRDSLNSLRAAGWSVVGVSPDGLDALARFKEKHSLNFPLASDPEREVLEAWGAWGEKKNYGRLVRGVIRSTFAIGTDGKVLVAQHNVKATGHVARLRRELGID